MPDTKQKRAKTWKERPKSFYPVNPPTRRRGSDFVRQQLRTWQLIIMHEEDFVANFLRPFNLIIN